jgi:hypothetical protein
MCMSCNTKGLSIRRKIILFSSLGSAIAGVSYLTFATTSNPAVAATIPAILSFAACPVMCIAMGGVMWFVSRFSKNKNNDNQMVMALHRAETQKREIKDSCCGNLHENKKTQNIEYKQSNNGSDEDSLVQPPSLWLRKYKNKQQKQN